jgi:hypothetical protein
MIRWGIVLGLAAVFSAFDAPRMWALSAADSPARNPGETTVNAGGGLPTPMNHDGPALRSNPLWAIPLSSLSATRERPLFAPSRRPPPAAIAVVPPAPRVAPPPKAEEPDHPPLTVVGTVTGETGGIGLFLDQTTNTIIRLKTGESHSGWVLSAIQGREASFERDHRTATLALPARSTARSGQSVVSALVPVGGTWTDGDGQQIAPPPAGTLQAAVGPPGGPLVPMSALARAGGAWTDGDGQEIASPPAAPQEVGATWTDGDGQQIAPPPGRMSQSMAASPVTDSELDQNVN